MSSSERRNVSNRLVCLGFVFLLSVTWPYLWSVCAATATAHLLLSLTDEMEPPDDLTVCPSAPTVRPRTCPPACSSSVRAPCIDRRPSESKASHPTIPGKIWRQGTSRPWTAQFELRKTAKCKPFVFLSECLINQDGTHLEPLVCP